MSAPARRLYVRDIHENDRIDGVFLVKFKSLQVGKTGKAYLNLVLMDSTGDIEARVWDHADEVSKGFDKDDFVMVKGRAQAFQGRTQLSVSEVARCNEQDVDLADFLPTTTKDVALMYADLRRIIEGMDDVHLRALLLAFVDDPELSWRIQRAPAAKTMHHAFVGGLLEHTLSAMKLMKLVAGHYRDEGYADINPDLLLTGIFLHDIGKTLELVYRRSFDYTDAGKLVGHLVLGIEMVNERAAKIPGFPEELRLLVNHMIAAHHGQLEYGSPRRPKTVEAVIVHAIDDLDAKVNSFTAAIEKDSALEGGWTSYNRLYERFLYKRPYRSQRGAAVGAGAGGGDPGLPQNEALDESLPIGDNN